MIEITLVPISKLPTGTIVEARSLSRALEGIEVNEAISAMDKPVVQCRFV